MNFRLATLLRIVVAAGMLVASALPLVAGGDSEDGGLNARARPDGDRAAGGRGRQGPQVLTDTANPLPTRTPHSAASKIACHHGRARTCTVEHQRLW